MSQRRKALSAVRTVVVKLGSQLLVTGEGSLDSQYLAALAAQIVCLRQRGVRVTVVSSGAIAAGVRELKLPARPTDLSQLQAAAAVGQRKLMDAWAGAFALAGQTADGQPIPVAQVLVTRDDINHRTRFLNLRNTLSAIHQLGAVPILNENDTISTDEIVRLSFGDNDILAALVAHALRANLLVLMSVVDGLQDPDGQPVRRVDDVAVVRQWVRADKSPLGKGGMNSKLDAAATVTHAGEHMAVVDGRMENVLPRLLEGDEVGTLFCPTRAQRSARDRWIRAVQTHGAVVIDDGAVTAITARNTSLLPIGVRGVEGAFERGDAVEIKSPDGRTVARGLSNYSAADVLRIMGRKTADVRGLLAEAAYDEVVHRDNLVIE